MLEFHTPSTPQKTSSTRDRLLKTTARLLQRKGYHGTGLSEILRTSKTPKGSLYHYFTGGKDELVIAALEGEAKKLTDDLMDVMENSLDLLAAMERVIDYFSQRLIESDYQVGSPLAPVAIEISNTHPHILAVCSRYYSEWEVVFSDKASKSGMPENKAEEFGRNFLIQLEGALLLSKIHKTPHYLQYLLNQFSLT